MSHREDTSVMIQELERRNPELRVNMGLQGEQGLKELIEKSDLASDPERLRQFLVVAENAKWVGTAAELTYRLSWHSDVPRPLEPYFLGINDSKYVSESMAEKLKATHWQDLYKMYAISGNDHTEKLMNHITHPGDPTEIFFFVPSKLFDHPRAGVTRDEMNWLLKNPDKATKVSFVFGVDEFIFSSWSKNMNRSYGLVMRHRQEEMLRWINDLFDPTLAQRSS